jgi:hypothetical protein
MRDRSGFQITARKKAFRITPKGFTEKGSQGLLTATIT